MNIKIWNIEEMTGYKPITTFYQDFSIADKFGIGAIKDTYNRAFKEWKNDYKYLTELAMVMSWKSFEHQDNLDYCKIYSNLYYETDNYALNTLKGDEQVYYIKTID